MILLFCAVFAISFYCKGQDNNACVANPPFIPRCDSCFKRVVLMKVIPDTVPLETEEITVQIKNLSPFYVTYGSYYFIQKETDKGKWEDVLKCENLGWELVLYMLEPNHQRILQLSLLKKVSSYVAGKYRIVKRFELTTTKRIYKPWVEAEFYLK